MNNRSQNEVQMDISSLFFSLETALQIMFHRNTKGHECSNSDIVVSGVILYDIYKQLAEKYNFEVPTMDSIVLDKFRIEIDEFTE